jgi:hypothetical protein
MIIVRYALSELSIAGLVRPLVHREGWRRARARSAAIGHRAT